jgi:protocatechuate 3,4-dioxygenase beta subunit
MMTEKEERSPEMVEGPYFSTGGQHRADLKEDRQGRNLELTIAVVDAASDEPLSGIDVEIWHCDATGHYSGYEEDPDAPPSDISNGQVATNEDTFLRGRLTTDADGSVTFKTIVPGWYALRTPHIHLKFIEAGVCNTTTQLFFPEALIQELLQTTDYARSGEQDTFNRTDPVIATTPGDIESLWIDLTDGSDGLVGCATIAIVPGTANDPIYPPVGRIPPLGGRPHDKPIR